MFSRISRTLPHTTIRQALRRPASRPTSHSQWRNSSSNAKGEPFKRRLGLVSGGSALLATVGLVALPVIHTDTLPSDPTVSQSFGTLVRSYAVFTMCSIPALVDNSPRLLQLASMPGISWFAEFFVRITFFDQFVGGDTAEKTLPLLHTLRGMNKGALFAYSVEVDETEATASSSTSSTKSATSPHKRIVDEMVHCIDVAADFEDGLSGKIHTGRRTWVAIKLSALLPDANILYRFSSHLINTRSKLPVAFPGCPESSDMDVLNGASSDILTIQDVAVLRDFHADLVRICERGRDRGVRIVVDAEYSWYQPAIDALTLALTRQFNKLPSKADQNTSPIQPLVYGTYQAYLQRTPELLAQSLADAKAGNYALGVKLVRGAYHSHELAAHKARLSSLPSLSLSPDPHPPVWLVKSDTDACYNASMRTLIHSIRDDVNTRRPKGASMTPTVGVLFGTHNWESCTLILDELVNTGLAVKGQGKGDVVMLPDDVTERVTIGQLYGMRDDLTNHLVNSTVSNTPLIIKYVPYGALSEVMPYLSRRAIENKSVLGGEGGAASERQRAATEIKKRLFGSWYTGK